jgi:hypothetical protein
MDNNRENLTLAASIMADLKDIDPESHKRVSERWYALLKDIKPNSAEGPTIRSFVMDIVGNYKDSLDNKES